MKKLLCLLLTLSSLTAQSRDLNNQEISKIDNDWKFSYPNAKLSTSSTKLDDLPLTQVNIVKNSAHLPTSHNYQEQFYITVDDINARSVGPELKARGYHLRIICTDNDIVNCDKFRMIMTAGNRDLSTATSYEVVHKTFDNGSRPLSAVELVDMLTEFERLVSVTGVIPQTKDYFAYTRAYAEVGAYFFLVGSILTTPVGLVIDIIKGNKNARDNKKRLKDSKEARSLYLQKMEVKTKSNGLKVERIDINWDHFWQLKSLFEFAISQTI